MQFKVISHAGLLVENEQSSLICDPWILGSCHWRSWWNYPPVSKELCDSISPDYIYITHVHWDHFQGDSLRKLGLDKTVIIPKGGYDRIKRDLLDMGFKDIIELRHGQSFQISDNFKITPYEFGVFLDSALVIEVDGKVLLDLNDSKHMGPTLRQIIKSHPPVDFVFRSHSSANGRLCYQIMDEPEAEVDNIEQYIKNFADTVIATGAKYAVPFASNCCHLHPEVVHFNKLVQTPKLVAQYFERNKIASPEVKVMVSGDAYHSELGFEIGDEDWFENREERLDKYYLEVKDKIDAQTEKENRVGVSLAQVEKYFKKFKKVVPWIVRRKFKHHPITYVLKKGDERLIFLVNVFSGNVTQLDGFNDEDNPIQIHTAAFLMRHCMALDLFSHLSIGKRVIYRAQAGQDKYIKLLNLLFNFYEYDMLPVWRPLTSFRFYQSWFLRWREIWLYVQLLTGKILYGKLDFSAQLRPQSKRRETV